MGKSLSLILCVCHLINVTTHYKVGYIEAFMISFLPNQWQVFLGAQSKFISTGTSGRESSKTPHHHSEGCSFPAPDSHPRVHVCRRGERGTGPTASVPEDCWEAQGIHKQLVTRKLIQICFELLIVVLKMMQWNNIILHATRWRGWLRRHNLSRMNKGDRSWRRQPIN